MIRLEEMELVFGHTNGQTNKQIEPDGQTEVEIVIQMSKNPEL